MNAQTVQLLSILSACRPDDEELARESRIGRIMQSEDYQGLSTPPGLCRAHAGSFHGGEAAHVYG